MISKKIVVTNPTGLHARPANTFVKEAARHACDVSIKKEGRLYNGKSIVSILSAGVKHGNEIELITEGEGEQQAMEDMVAAVKSGLGESQHE
ncbi:MAG TPA: HPr family phosphocarrier protein [Anaerovoracaceae bacterium]|nr:HPr family phosphocarrier protein [Anaerovoracaceae bacterium]